MGKNKPSLRDVAREAKVSASAVWMAIHNKPGVAPATSRRIWETISLLGYTVKPRPVGEAVNTVGLLIEKSSIPAIMDSFYGDVISGFQAEAQRCGYHVNLVMFDRTNEPTSILKNGFIKSITGLRILDDIAIASIDNIAESAYCRPPLTTVHIPKREMGVLAFQRLHHLITSGNDIPVKNIVYSKLIVRESSGAVLSTADT